MIDGRRDLQKLSQHQHLKRPGMHTETYADISCKNVCTADFSMISYKQVEQNRAKSGHIKSTVLAGIVGRSNYQQQTQLLVVIALAMLATSQVYTTNIYATNTWHQIIECPAATKQNVYALASLIDIQQLAKTSRESRNTTCCLPFEHLLSRPWLWWCNQAVTAHSYWKSSKFWLCARLTTLRCWSERMILTSLIISNLDNVFILYDSAPDVN